LVHSLYVEAGTPVLDDIVQWIELDYAAGRVPNVPSRDRVGDCIGSTELPTKQSDAITIAGTLASRGRRNPTDAKDQARQLWGAAYDWTPLGRPIADLDDPFALEVHPSVDVIARPTGLSVLPMYIEREHDTRLREVVARAAMGRSAIAVLVGGSSTGKTRACWEAVKARKCREAAEPLLLDGWRLWHPLDPGRPEAAARVLSQIGPRTVVWLNETQYYLLTPADQLGEQVAAGLRELLRDPDRSPVLVLGTIWPEYWGTLSIAPNPGHDDSHPQARALLTGVAISVPDAFTGRALTDLQAHAADDPLLAAALTNAQDGQITQFLAGVPALVERYNNAPDAGRALIEAAVDARRLGHSLALPQALLEAAVPGYLSDQQWDALDEDWLEQALAYTTARCRGVRGPLTRIRPRPGHTIAGGPHYRVSDYLEQLGHVSGRTWCAPASLWDALTVHATPEDRVRLGSEAERRSLYRYALQLWDAAAEAGDTVALRLRAARLREEGRTEEAITYYRRAAEAGDAGSVGVAASMLKDAGRAEEAITWIQACATEWIQACVAEAGDIDILVLWLRADVLREAGRTEEAITYYRRAAEAGDAGAIGVAASMLKDAGRTEEAITWLQARAEAGETNALGLAADLLREAGRTEEAITYYRRAAEAGDTNGFWFAFELLNEAGRTKEAITWLQACVDAGHYDALCFVVALFRDAGRTEEAITWLQACVEAGNIIALSSAVELLNEAGRTDEAITWLQARAEAGETNALGLAADLLREAGRTEEATTYYRRAAQAGDTNALGLAAHVLREAGRTEEAIACHLQAAEAGKTFALECAAGLLKEAGRNEEAVQLLRYGIEPQGWHRSSACARSE
jgi:tetratricopeptide (TPR) repeat protein